MSDLMGMRMVLACGLVAMGAAHAAPVPLEECLPCTADCAGETALDDDGDSLTACQEACLGSSDSNADSDGDGMPDGWEARYCLDPAADDIIGMPDGDAFNNLQEFQRGSDPLDADSPGPTFHVSTEGLDNPANGAADAPFRTINYAISQATAMAADTPVLFIDFGLYEEDVELTPGIILVGAGPTEILGAMTGAEGAELINLLLIAPPGGVALAIDGVAMKLERCSIRGDRETSTGIQLTGAAPRSVSVHAGSITEVLVGIDADAALPLLSRMDFSNIGAAAILVRCDDAQAPLSQPPLQDPGAGFNVFRSTLPQVAIVNQCGTPLHLDRNEWGVEPATEAGIAARIDGEVNYSGFLPSGATENAATLRCHVYRAGTVDTPLAGASVRIAGLTAVTDTHGRAVFNALPAGAAQLTVEADGFATQTRMVTLRGVFFGNSEVFYLEVDEGATPAPACNCTDQKLGAPQPGQLLISMLVMALLGAWTLTLRRQQTA